VFSAKWGSARPWLVQGRGVVLGLGLGLGLVACGGSSSGPTPAPGVPVVRPNFVVIVADDMARDLFGAGHRFPFYELPNLDRLAARGVLFDRAFVTTSLCSPSRATMLSGLYAHTHGVLGNEARDLAPGTATYPMLLQQAGYKTAFVGKWHMDSSKDTPRPGFDYWLSFKGQGAYEDPTLDENGRSVKRTGYLTDILTDYAVQWLKARGNEPFLLVLSHKAAHDPFHPAPRHAAALSDAALPEPANFEDSFLTKPVWQRRYVLCGGSASDLARCPDPPPAFLPRWPWAARERWRLEYLRTLLALDDSVGSVVATLQTQGFADSTYIVFVGDNGMFLGEHRLGDKRLMYEESIRVPFLVAGPRVAARRSAALVLNLDLAPTLLQLAGVGVPASMQGRSLAGLLQGGPPVRDSFLYEYFADSVVPAIPSMVGVRTERWAYVTYPGRGSEDELYDVDGDPGEMTSLSDSPAAAAQKLALRTELQRLLAATGAPLL
jgi:N-acetylglucosamine-6-sulfatase